MYRTTAIVVALISFGIAVLIGSFVYPAALVEGWVPGPRTVTFQRVAQKSTYQYQERLRYYTGYRVCWDADTGVALENHCVRMDRTPWEQTRVGDQIEVIRVWGEREPQTHGYDIGAKIMLTAGFLAIAGFGVLMIWYYVATNPKRYLANRQHYR